jgi:hypothetical protein
MTLHLRFPLTTEQARLIKLCASALLEPTFILLIDSATVALVTRSPWLHRMVAVFFWKLNLFFVQREIEADIELGIEAEIDLEIEAEISIQLTPAPKKYSQAWEEESSPPEDKHENIPLYHKINIILENGSSWQIGSPGTRKNSATHLSQYSDIFVRSSMLAKVTADSDDPQFVNRSSCGLADQLLLFCFSKLGICASRARNCSDGWR